MIFELRLYSVVPGRLADLHARFERLPPLFARHGIECVGQWTATTGPRAPHFMYLMVYRDFAQREATWASFAGDADWLALRTQTNAGSEIVDRFDLWFLRPHAAWAPDTALAGQRRGGLQEMVLFQVALGQAGATQKFLAEDYLPWLQRQGAEVMGLFDVISGPELPRVVLVLSWSSDEARRTAWSRMVQDEALNRAIKAQRDSIGRALLGRADDFLLEPAAFALPEASLGAACAAR